MSALRNPVVISSLEEDLKKIGLTGLVREQDDSSEDPAPEVDADGGNPMEGEGEDEPKDAQTEAEDGEDGEDEKEPMEAKNLVKNQAARFLRAYAPVTPKPVGARVESRNGKKGKTLTESRKVSKGPAKPFVKPLKESRTQRLHRLAEGKIFESAKRPVKTGVSKIDALLEEVGSIVGDLNRTKKVERIEGFANIAVIAEMLQRRFRMIGMALSEGNIYRVADQMKKLSEQAGDMAIGMDGGEEPKQAEQDEPPPGDPKNAMAAEADGDDAQVDALFKKFMAKLLDALQLYNDVTGKSEQDEVPGDEEEPGDDDGMPPEDEATAIEQDDVPGDEEEPPGDDSEEEPTDEQDETEPEGDEPEQGEEEPEEEPTNEEEETPYGQPDEEGCETTAPSATEQVRKILGLGEARKARVESARARRTEGKGGKKGKRPLKMSKAPGIKERMGGKKKK